MDAAELDRQLHLLSPERASAELDGSAGDLAYLADPQDEIAACRRAYVLAAVGEIARLRAGLSGSLEG